MSPNTFCGWKRKCYGMEAENDAAKLNPMAVTQEFDEVVFLALSSGTGPSVNCHQN